MSISKYTITILTQLLLIQHINSQACLPELQSPNNPPNACTNQLSVFDLTLDPGNACLCCTSTGLPDDNPADECRFAIPATANKTAMGTLVCNENFDCCSCEAIECINCATVQCSGDSSCLGVSPIVIDGECDLQGATLECNGDVSCFRSKVYGECITAVDCNGDNSCGETVMEINQNTPVPDSFPPIFFILNGDRSLPRSRIYAKNVGGFTCGGDESCAFTILDLECRTNMIDTGCELEVGGDNAAPNSQWNVTGADLVSCKGNNACSNTIFIIECVRGGCPVQMTGDNSAPDTILNIINVNEFSCAGYDSCPHSTANIACVNNYGIGCSVIVTGDRAAQSADWTIINSNQFDCVGINGCAGGIFKMNCVTDGCPITCSMSCPDTMFEVINSNGVICNGVITQINGLVLKGTCEDAIFKLDNNIGGSILCAGTRACQNTRFMNTLGGPVTNIDMITCAAYMACLGTNAIITPQSSSFVLICSGTASCKMSNIDIRIINEYINSIQCNAMESCQGALISISRMQIGALILQKLECGGSHSCRNALINVNANGLIELENIICNGASSCKDLTLNINILNNVSSFRTQIICGASNACVNFQVNVNGLVGSVPLSRIDITIDGCQTPQNCFGASINQSPFVSFN